MTEVLVTGIGLVSSLSNHLNQTWQKLITGKSGIQFHQPFPELSPLPLGLINLQPTGLNELTQLVVAEAKYSHLIQSWIIEVSKGSKERMEKDRVIQVKDGQTEEE